MPCCARKRLTFRQCQYRHERGHSIATHPPWSMQVRAAISKLSQSLLAIARWRAILRRVLAPRIMLIRVHMVPPVHGIAANSNTDRILPSGRQLCTVLLSPCVVVALSVDVMRTTWQSVGDVCPSREYSPQQYSTIRLVTCAAGEADEEHEGKLMSLRLATSGSVVGVCACWG